MSDHIVEEKIELSSKDAANVLGAYDVYAKKIEKTLRVSIVDRNGSIVVLGQKDRAAAAGKHRDRHKSRHRQCG